MALGHSSCNCRNLFYRGNTPLSDYTNRVELLSFYNCRINTILHDIAIVYLRGGYDGKIETPVKIRKNALHSRQERKQNITA
jgi:hypothetical protein